MSATIRNAATAAIGIVVLASAAIAAPVPSAAYGEPQTMAVRYDDLDLASDTGAARFARRVNHAVNQVCGSPDTREIAQRRLADACRAETLARTRPRMETALAAARDHDALAQGGGKSSLRVTTASLR